MLWLKAFHIIFMVTWFAGLFYLPRLFVYHANTTDRPGLDRFKVMERKLYLGIMTPGALLTIISGMWIVAYNPAAYLQAGWLYIKLIAVFLLIVFHCYCGKLLLDFKEERNCRTHIFYRWLNEIPTLLLLAIIILAVIKPF